MMNITYKGAFVDLDLMNVYSWIVMSGMFEEMTYRIDVFIHTGRFSKCSALCLKESYELKFVHTWVKSMFCAGSVTNTLGGIVLSLRTFLHYYP